MSSILMSNGLTSLMMNQLGSPVTIFRISSNSISTMKIIFGKNLPYPVLKRVKKAGSGTYNLLSWEGESGGKWIHEDFFKLLCDDGEIFSTLETENSCNTRKSRDKVRYFIKVINEPHLSL